MHMKSSNLLYLFEFNNTLFNCHINKNIYNKWKSFFKSKLYINPHTYDIRWSILSDFNLIEKPLIKTCCLINGITPENIITYHKYYYCLQNDKEKYLWKFNIMQNILIKGIYNNRKITRIVYIDNNLNINDNINNLSRQKGIPIISQPVVDFINKTYKFLL